MPGKCKPCLIAGLLTLWCTVAAARDVNMFSAIKSGGSFVQSDLEGDWSMQALSVEGDGAQWIKSGITIASNGDVNGTGVDSDTANVAITGGSCLISSTAKTRMVGRLPGFARGR